MSQGLRGFQGCPEAPHPNLQDRSGLPIPGLLAEKTLETPETLAECSLPERIRSRNGSS
jgi:hypothetical protein